MLEDKYDKPATLARKKKPSEIIAGGIMLAGYVVILLFIGSIMGWD